VFDVKKLASISDMNLKSKIFDSIKKNQSIKKEKKYFKIFLKNRKN